MNHKINICLRVDLNNTQDYPTWIDTFVMKHRYSIGLYDEARNETSYKAVGYWPIYLEEYTGHPYISRAAIVDPNTHYSYRKYAKAINES